MPEKKFAPLTLRIPVDIHRAARIKSVETNRSLNEVVVEKLREWVKEDKPKRDTKPS